MAKSVVRGTRVTLLKRVCLLAVVLSALVSIARTDPAAAITNASPWCGTTATADRPAIVAGKQIRVVYAYPSDGQDRSAELATQISADIDAIQSWWLTQDASRVPRFDLASFACGTQVDLTVIKLTETTSRLLPFDTRADRIFEDIPGAESQYLTFLVYFDGPIERADICGQGGGEVGEAGYGVVYLQACDVASARVVAAHELGHSLGAMPHEGPPHGCEDDAGHPCDSTADLMYPEIQTPDLFSLQLDSGRDDYYGHSGTWSDVQDSSFLRWNDRQVKLDVSIAGKGRVESDVPGVICSAQCSSEWNAGSAPQLFAVPAAGLRLLRWTGACSRARGFTCSLALAGNTQAGAQFVKASFRLSVSVRGQGRVTSRPTGLACPARCARAFQSFSPVRLTASPRRGWRLKTWSGACNGAGTTCTVAMSKAKAVRAVFVKPR